MSPAPSLAAEGAEREKDARGGTLLLLVLLVLAGLVLRTRDLDAFRPSTDEGEYIRSAQLRSLGRAEGEAERSFGAALAADARWAREMLRDFTRVEDKSSYPHSYLHQLAARWARRAGAGYLESVRLPSAILGALCAPALWLVLRGRGRRGAALLAAALTAFLPVLVWVARTGWGQSGCTFFWILFLGLGWRVLDPARVPSAAHLAWSALGLAALSLAAYGWHEMVVVHVAALGLAACVAPLWGAGAREGGFARRLLASRRLWTVVVAALPALALVLALRFLSGWAQEVWLDPNASTSFAQRVRLGLRFLFVLTRVQVQVTWPVLLCVPFGIASLWRRERPFTAYLLVIFAGSTLPFVLLFNRPDLVRIYLPAIAILVLFAAEGACWLGARLPERLALARPLGALSLCAYVATVSWISLFGRMDHPLAVSELYWPRGSPLLESRHSEEPLYAVLRAELTPGEAVGAFVAFEHRTQLEDAGFVARGFSFDLPRERWPRFVIGVESHFVNEMRARYGESTPYALVTREHAGRVALFRRDES